MRSNTIKKIQRQIPLNSKSPVSFLTAKIHYHQYVKRLTCQHSWACGNGTKDYHGELWIPLLRSKENSFLISFLLPLPPWKFKRKREQLFPQVLTFSFFRYIWVSSRIIIPLDLEKWNYQYDHFFSTFCRVDNEFKSI